MNVSIERLTPWSLALECARETMGKHPTGKEPSHEWKVGALTCEHSPIRTVMFAVHMLGIPTFVSVHFVRHKIGVEHFVKSQRSDRSASGASRHDLPQDAPVDHLMVCNAAAILQMARFRLCGKASAETRAVMESIVGTLRTIGETELADLCVPRCVQMGGRCPELQGCGRAPMILREEG